MFYPLFTIYFLFTIFHLEGAEYNFKTIPLEFEANQPNKKNPLTAISNPFKINFPRKENLTEEDYKYIQNQLKRIDVSPIVKLLYPAFPGFFPDGFTTYNDFWGRVSKGSRQVLIDPQKKLYPSTVLEKINDGGDMCVACFASYNLTFAKLLKSIPEELKKSGFNGYFYARIGGYPNPTGEEIQYVGVPYSYKIFLMLEAKKLGFKKVLGIDSSFLPLRDPTPLFKWIAERDVLFIGQSPTEEGLWRYIFPETQQLLLKLTGNDVLRTDPFVWGGLLGLNFDSPKVNRFISQFYDMVKLGTPFLSCYPEQFVYTALMAKPEFNWKLSTIENIYIDTDGNDTDIAEMRDYGYYFYNRRH